jgi:hemerythrin superfamily protein
MDAIALLKSQHREVEKIFEMIEKSEDSSEKKELCRDVTDALAGHAAIEEQIFYPGVMGKDTEDILRESVEEHLAVKRIIADVLEISVSEETFEAKMKVLKEMVLHHVEEEENELFPLVKKACDPNELEEMGEKMEALFAELSEQDPRRQVPSETGEAAPLPEPR